jgi:hypothetical protein
MSQAYLTVRAVLMAAAALLVSTSLAPSAATAREKADRATDDDCAVLSAVFREPNSLVTLRNFYAGRLGYGPLGAAVFQQILPQLSATEAADLALGESKAGGRYLIPACDWRKLGFDRHDTSLRVVEYPPNLVTRPIISTSGAIAFIYTYAQWTPLDGQGRYCLLRKRDNVWRVESCVFDGTVS